MAFRYSTPLKTKVQQDRVGTFGKKKLMGEIREKRLSKTTYRKELLSLLRSYG